MDAQTLKKLRQWFKRNAAELPWRPADLDATRNPYAVWISETMLQQTQVSTVRGYFTRWMQRFPNIETLAKASEEEVFKYWQGLGYYSRARNILKTAQIVHHDKCNSTLPDSRKELEELPGIGAYTAGAILSLAYHQREAILDGNLVRIFSRLYALDFLPIDKNVHRGCHAPCKGARNDISASEIYWDYAREVANSPKAYIHNEALMELGRTICKVKNPDCANCPLHSSCRAAQENRISEFPPSKSIRKKTGTAQSLSLKAPTIKFWQSMAGKSSSKTSSPCPTSNHRAMPPQVSPHKQNTTLTQTRSSPLKALASSVTTLPSTRWNAMFCTFG